MLSAASANSTLLKQWRLNINQDAITKNKLRVLVSTTAQPDLSDPKHFITHSAFTLIPIYVRSLLLQPAQPHAICSLLQQTE